MVPGRVPVPIVDLLEIVQVEQDDPVALPGPGGLVGFLQPPVQERPVAHPGQAVVAGPMVDVLEGSFQDAHGVVQGGTHTPDLVLASEGHLLAQVAPGRSGDHVHHFGQRLGHAAGDQDGDSQGRSRAGQPQHQHQLCGPPARL